MTSSPLRSRLGSFTIVAARTRGSHRRNLVDLAAVVKVAGNETTDWSDQWWSTGTRQGFKDIEYT